MKIFVVDDNPHVLALMQKTLEPHGDVESYSDGSDALLRATEAPPDLIVSDFRMKNMDGRALVQRLRGRAETRDVPVILVASKSDIDEELQSISDQVEELVPKPFYARDLVQRAKRVLLNRRQSDAASTGGSIRGRLSEMNIMDLFQTMEIGVKTCQLAMSNGVDTAHIYFLEGQVFNCQMGSLAGDAVVNQVVKWKDGTFEINFSAPRPAASNTKTGTQGLLMEAMRLMDEENR
jgi:CheY-like chemotaxis protein